MKRPFSATVWQEGEWFVAQCLEVDVASQGETEEQALANLKEALELYFEPPRVHLQQKSEPSRLRLGRLRPLSFREVNRRLEAAGFIEASQRGSHVKFVRHSGEIIETRVQSRAESIQALSL